MPPCSISRAFADFIAKASTILREHWILPPTCLCLPSFWKTRVYSSIAVTDENPGETVLLKNRWEQFFLTILEVPLSYSNQEYSNFSVSHTRKPSSTDDEHNIGLAVKFLLLEDWKVSSPSVGEIWKGTPYVDEETGVSNQTVQKYI